MSPSQDRICGLYSGKTLFITGVTGFLGKILLEKILRCCPDVGKIYVLIRKKRAVPAPERLKSIFQNPLFDLLRKENPNAFAKCITVGGDVSEVDLAISDYYRNVISNEVDYIFHCAASTRFDDPIMTSIIINARGTHYMLELAKQCKKLQLFVHVSTLFAHYQEATVEEKVYGFPRDPKHIIESLPWTDEESLQNIAKDLFPDLPNTYTFSKMLAEALVAQEINNLPILITRPSIVGTICYDPYPGWANSLVGPIGLFVAAGKGILRTCYMNKRNHCKMFPADSTINGILVSVWDYMENKGCNIANLYHREDQIKLTWEEVVEIGKDVVRNKVPFNVFLWYPDGSMTDNKLLYLINFYLFHYIPAVFVDFLLILMGYKPALFKAQRRIHKSSDMFKYYTFKEWNFQVDTIPNIKKKLNDFEKELYRTDADGYDVKEYLINSLRAVKKIQLKENEKHEKTMIKVMKTMYYVDRLFKVFFAGLFFFYISKIMMHVYKL